MKHLKSVFLFGFLMALASSCADLDEINASSDTTVSRIELRNIEEIDEIAISAYNFFIGNGGEVVNLSSRSSLNLSHVTIVDHSSRAMEADTLIYVVNFDENDGFVMIGAPKNSEPVLAFIEEGNYNTVKMHENPGFQLFVESAKQSIRANIDTTAIVPKLETKTVVEWEYLKKVGPKINLWWGQRDYEGMYSPNKLAGCTMAAALMVMAYYEQPKSMVFDFPEADCQSAYINWPRLKQHFTRHDVSTDDMVWVCPLNESEHYNLGRITRQIGYHLNANYNYSSTSLWDYIAASYIAGLMPNIENYTIGRGDDRYDILAELEQGIFMTYGSNKSNTNAHTWVTDGYVDVNICRNVYEKIPGIVAVDWKLVSHEVLERRIFMHHNWGNYGLCNGYFNEDCFYPGEVVKLDDGAVGSTIFSDYCNNVRYNVLKPSND